MAFECIRLYKFWKSKTNCALKTISHKQIKEAQSENDAPILFRGENMAEKEIDCTIVWFDEEVAEIICPYCKKEVRVNIYKDSYNQCECGKRFRLIQSNYIVEVT